MAVLKDKRHVERASAGICAVICAAEGPWRLLKLEHRLR